MALRASYTEKWVNKNKEEMSLTDSDNNVAAIINFDDSWTKNEDGYYNLTRAQAEQQKQYIASHTNYTNYNYPYLYWVGVSCTNGYSEAWTRSRGQQYFN